jgi:hypothetical protein
MWALAALGFVGAPGLGLSLVNTAGNRLAYGASHCAVVTLI